VDNRSRREPKDEAERDRRPLCGRHGMSAWRQYGQAVDQLSNRRLATPTPRGEH
jgi:hypothetical protein